MNISEKAYKRELSFDELSELSNKDLDKVIEIKKALFAKYKQIKLIKVQNIIAFQELLKEETK